LALSKFYFMFGIGLSYRSARLHRLAGIDSLESIPGHVKSLKIPSQDCVDIGVVGFRIDAAKHMWPGDIEATIAKVGSLPEGDQLKRHLTRIIFFQLWKVQYVKLLTNFENLLHTSLIYFNCFKFDLVWLNLSPNPVRRRGVISSFN
jgi:hypothetical protein